MFFAQQAEQTLAFTINRPPHLSCNTVVQPTMLKFVSLLCNRCCFIVANISTTSLFTEITLMVLRCKQVTRGGRGGGSSTDVLARRLAQGCKCRILVSLRVFWQNVIVFSRKDLFQGCTRRYIFCQFVLFTQFMYSIASVPKEHCNKMVSFRVKTRLAHAQVGLLKGFNSKFPTSIPAPFIWQSPPG